MADVDESHFDELHFDELHFVERTSGTAEIGALADLGRHRTPARPHDRAAGVGAYLDIIGEGWA